MKNITSFFKNIRCGLTILFLLFNIYYSFSQVDLRTCGFNCTSNNYTLTDVYLSLSSVNGTPIGNTPCTIGQSQQVYIYLNYSSNSSSTVHFARLNSDLNIGGTTTFVNVFLGDIVPGNNIKLLYGPFNWVCGDELSLTNTIIAWKTSSNGDPGPNYQCSSYSNSQCDFTNAITISKPLAVQFSYKACKVGNNTTVNFTSTTNGGKTPYTYAWDFQNDGGAPDSALSNPTYVYTTPNNTAKLTVTDAQNMSNSYTLAIIQPTELMVSETHTTIGCSGGTSSITLNVTGGTPGYTYLWNTGATTMNLSNVSSGTYSVTVKDNNNCTKQLSVTIPGGDTIKPVINPLPAPSTISCPNTPVFTQAVATDNSGTVSSLTYTEVNTPGSCPGTYSITRTWIATDACNNQSLPVSQTINVVDTTPPVWSTAAASLNVTLQCSNTSGLATAQSQAPVATDNCGGVITYTKTSGSFVAGSCANAGTYTNTWVAKDVCNNTSSVFTQVITIEDTQVPVWSTLASSLNVTLQCSDTSGLASAQSQAPVATDNCGGVITYTKTSGSFVAGACANAGTYTNTWTAKDVCDNTSSVFTQVITIEDTQVPAWSTTASALNITLQCSDTLGLADAQSQSPVATDNCGGVITYTKTSGSFVAGACANAGTYTNTWTAKDVCNNTSSVFTQVITIQDTQVPVWSTAASALNVTLQCSDTSGLASAQSQAPVATDNCGGVITYTKTSGAFVAGACANAGTYTNTWIAKDVCNNTSSVFTQVITIEDTQVPIWSTATSGLNVTLQCSDIEGLATAQSQSPVATDNCGGVITYTKTSGSFVAEACANAGTYTNTWTAKDVCNNTSSVFTQVITIEDTQVPVWSTLASSLNVTLQCSDTSGLASAQSQAPVATDNCGGIITYTKTSGSFVSEACANAGTYTNTWTAKDVCDNTSSVFTQVITIEDTQVPAWSTLASALNVTLQCSDIEGLATAQSQSPVAMDNCGGVITYTKTSGSFVAGSCANAGTYTNTWTAKDVCNNTSSVFTQVITIEDTQVPVWSTTASALNITLQCSDTSGLISAQSQAPVATDNCGGVITYTKTSGAFIAGACANAGTYTNTWTAKDVCNNTSLVFTQVITIEDTQVPVWSTESVALNITLECSDAEGLAAAQSQAPVASDNCGGTITYTKTSGAFVAGACANAGTYTNTWTAKDVCNNTTSVFTQVITIEDTQVPVWSTLASSLNVTLQCSDTSGLASAQSQAPVATDNCGGVITYTKTSGSFVAGACANAGTYTNTWTAKDVCDNTSSVFTQVITIEDTQVPAWSTLASALNVTLQCSDIEGLATAQSQSPVATDNCGGVITYTKTSGSFVAGVCANAGTYTNTWTATDGCNNTSLVFTQVITIEDTQVPVWSTESVALNVTLECSDAEGLATAQSQTPVATDNCGGVITYTKTSGEFIRGECDNSGSYTNTWTATDGCNNTSLVFTQVITIEDTQVPVWSTLASSLNVTLQCSDTSGLASAQSQAPVATDNCGGVITYTKTSGSFVAGACANAGTYTNTWTAKDVCDNTSSVFTQVITIEDTQVPAWSTLASALNVTLQCSDIEGLATAQSQSPVATDNCGGVITYTKTSGSFVAGSCANAGTYTNTWVAKDVCNNTSSVFTQVITIEDTKVPVWSTLASSLNVTLQCSDDEGLASAQSQAPVATDNCSGTIIYTKTSGEFIRGECDNSGSYTNTWTATDGCNNTSLVFTQVITIEDTQVPLWSTAASALNVTLQCSDAEGLASAQSQAPVATDNCGGFITYTKTSGSFVADDCANSGTYTNTWTATDGCNNTSSVFTQVITIEDTQMPMWTTSPGALDQTLQCSNTVGLASAQSQAPVATDNCGGTIVYTKTSGSFVAGACANAGTYTNTWTAKDVCNNTSSVFTQVITIEDTQVPVWSTTASALNITLQCSDTSGLISAQSQAPIATDNCGGVITYTKTSGEFIRGECDNSGSYTNTWTATDGCNNTSLVFSQVITIEDTQVPVWSTTASALNITLQCSDTSGLISAQSQAPIATDNCGGVITYTKTSGEFIRGECDNSGSYTNTWTATDGCNNTSSVFTQVITIEDTQMPMWTTSPGALDQTLQCSNTVGLASAQSQAPVATDNCGGVITYTKTSGSFVAGVCANTGTYTNTWTAKDMCNNTSSVFTQVITIEDTQVPIWSTTASALNITLQCSDTSGLASAQSQAPVATDNCGGIITYTKTSGSFVSEACANAGTYTNTWTAKDVCNNTSSVFTQVITIEDTQVPLWSTEASSLNVTLQCIDAEGLANAQSQAPVATDNCGGVITYTKTSGSFVAGACANTGTYTNTWTAKDVCNNTSSVFTQVITIEDTQVPLWSTESIALNVTLECSDVSGLTTAQSQAPVATDNCGGAITYIKTSGSFVAGACANAGTYTNTWTAKDVCNNTSSVFTQVITIEDTQVPAWSTLASALNVTLQCSNIEGLATAQSQSPVATDNCGGVITYTKTSGSFVAGACANAGTYTNTWTAKDVCNNTSSVFTQVITIEDTQVPIWSTATSELNVTLQCSDIEGLATAQSQSPVATDNCGGVITYTKTSGSFVAGVCANAGTYTNTWTAKDVCNNTSSVFTQVITIEDTQVPVWSTTVSALNVTLQCSDAEGLASAQSQAPFATDNCGGTIIYTKTSGAFIRGECDNSGSYTNTWTAKDVCNNTSSVFTQVITIQDTQVPLWSTESIALNVTLECSDVSGLTTAQSQAPVATDNCGGIITYTKTSGEFIRGECDNSGSYTNTWTATDGCNNTSLAFTQVITIEDTQVPVWTTAASALNVTLECSDAEGLATAQSQAPVATDNCGGVITYTKTSGAFIRGECDNSGSYTNTWTATDGCNNTSLVFTQVITIEDTQVPLWSTESIALNVTLECSDVSGLTTAQSQAPVATDNCGGVITYTKTSGAFIRGECDNSGSYTNTWTATDGCNNTSLVFTQVITIEDTQVPIWSTESVALNITLECSDAEGLATAQSQAPVATDNCGVINYTKTSGSFVSGACANAGTYTNTWIASDGCGNPSIEFIQVITIEDTTPPTFIGDLPADVTVSCDDVPVPATLMTSDNCNLENVSIVYNESIISTECKSDYTLIREWTASDCAGNNTTYTQTITVRDTTPPTGTAPEDLYLQDVSEIPDANPAAVTNVADNCSDTVDISVSDVDNGGVGCADDPYIITRTFILSDCSGNTTTLVQTITVILSDINVKRVSGTACNEDNVQVDLNSFLPNDIPAGGTWRGTNNSLNVDRGLIDVFGLQAGLYEFEYIKLAEICPSLFMSLKVNENCKVIECEPILVHNAFSPNGDNINERFVIDNIDNTTCYPDNTVEIYNRWGILVFETRNYNNTTNAFEGISKGRTTISQAEGLPTGTYFYILNYSSVDGDGTIQTHNKSGYLFLSR